MVTRVYGLGPSCVPNVARAKYPKLADGGARGGLAGCNARHRLPRKGGRQCFYSKEKLDCSESGISACATISYGVWFVFALICGSDTKL